jgi:hypothetical protein
MATPNLAVINGACATGSASQLPGYYDSDEAGCEQWVREQQRENLQKIALLIEEAGIGYLYEDEDTQRARLDEVMAIGREIERLGRDWYELDRL